MLAEYIPCCEGFGPWLMQWFVCGALGLGVILSLLGVQAVHTTTEQPRYGVLSEPGIQHAIGMFFVYDGGLMKVQVFVSMT